MRKYFQFKNEEYNSFTVKKNSSKARKYYYEKTLKTLPFLIKTPSTKRQKNSWYYKIGRNKETKKKE